jgi:hypothetical protein
MNAQQQEQARKIWDEDGNGIKRPNILFCDSPPDLESTVLYTVNDDKSVYKFITRNESVYMVVSSKCKIIRKEGMAPYYEVSDPKAFHYVSCTMKEKKKFTSGEEGVAMKVVKTLDGILYNIV